MGLGANFPELPSAQSSTPTIESQSHPPSPPPPLILHLRSCWSPEYTVIMLSSLRCQKTRIVRSLTNARPIAIHSRNVIPSAIRSYAIGIRTEAESDLYEKEWKGMMNIAAAEAVEDNGPRQLQSPKNLDNEVDERERKKARAAYHAHLELRTFSNPTNMVRHVSRHLERGEYDVAYEIVKQAGAKLRSVPGWNLLIDYWMNKGHIDDAFKVYNNVGAMTYQFLTIHTDTPRR